MAARWQAPPSGARRLPEAVNWRTPVVRQIGSRRVLRRRRGSPQQLRAGQHERRPPRSRPHGWFHLRPWRPHPCSETERYRSGQARRKSQSRPSAWERSPLPALVLRLRPLALRPPHRRRRAGCWRVFHLMSRRTSARRQRLAEQRLEIRAPSNRAAIKWARPPVGSRPLDPQGPLPNWAPSTVRRGRRLRLRPAAVEPKLGPRQRRPALASRPVP